MIQGLFLLVIGIAAISIDMISITDNIDDFYSEYSFLKGTKVLAFYDVKCYSGDLSRINHYLLVSREQYLEFLNNYESYNITDDSISSLGKGVSNYLKKEKLIDFMKKIQKNYLLFTKYLAEATVKYGKLIDNDYIRLKKIGADNSDFPGILRKYYLDYDYFEKYLKGTYDKKNLEYYLRNFALSLEYQSKTKKPIYRKVSYDFFYNSVKPLCHNHIMINNIINEYEKEITIKKQEIFKKYYSLKKKFKDLYKYCDQFNQELKFYDNATFIIKKGLNESIFSLCLKIENILNNFNFEYYSSEDDDYIYLNYVKLKKQELILNNMEKMVNQIKESIDSLNKSCFEKLDNLRNTEKNPYFLSILNKKINNYKSCVRIIENYYYLKKNFNNCNVLNLKKLVYGLDQVGYDVSTEISMLKYCEYGTDNYFCCTILPNNVMKKYSKFLINLRNLENKAFEILKFLKKLGIKKSLNNYNDPFKKYLYLKETIPELEKEFYKYVVDYLKQNVVFKYVGSVDCNNISEFYVIVQVYNPFNFSLDISFKVSDIFGDYIISKPIFPGKNEYNFLKHSIGAICSKKLISRIGDMNITKEIYVINVSSVFNKIRYCVDNGIFEKSYTNCVYLKEGLNKIILNKKTDIIVKESERKIILDFGDLKYNVFLFKWNNTTYIFKNVYGTVLINKSIKVEDEYNFYKKYYSLNKSYDFYFNRFKNNVLNLIDQKINKTKNKKDIENLVLEKYRINKTKNLTYVSNKYKNLSSKFYINKNKYFNKIEFICYFNVSLCKNLFEKLDEISNNNEKLMFEKYLNEKIDEIKKEVRKKVYDLKIYDNLLKLRLAIGNDSIYQTYKDQISEEKKRLFDDLDNGKKEYVYHYNRIKNINSEILGIVDSRKEKAKYIIYRIKELIQQLNSPEKYSEKIEKLIKYYKAGEYKKVIDIGNDLIKQLELLPKEKSLDYFDILSFIIIVVIIGIGLYYISKSQNKQNKRIVLKKD